MDFAALPPEVNSGLMYTGAGAGPLLAAGAAWNGMAVELSTTAASIESIIAQLTGELWLGPASLAAAAAAQPYIAWLAYTGAAAEQAGVQAMASAAAYEAAFAATVPPPIIAANRALLAALVATNFLGINTPAIMLTEGHYMEMWAQDAMAMYGYAAASGAAGVLSPLTPPSQATNPGGIAAQAAAVSQAAASSGVTQLTDLITALPNTISGLASPVTSVLDATGLTGIISDIDALMANPFIANICNGAINTAAWFVMAAIPNAIFLSNALAPTEAAAEAVEGAAGAAAAAGAGLAESVAPAAGAGAISAGLGEASLVGSLSVPASWSSAAPATASTAGLLSGSGWSVPEEAAPVSGMAGMPGMAAAAKGAGAYAGPRYGFKPIVMPKQVVV
ncbi:PPE family protein [Mycobacterium attenuatum]|uniref:PPE family protein n=1 Tax=Mycobacterium attenuatum TaxID=2341086 RepID=UPI000F0245C1|nr:PPE family protein [Mycobacterium attenuatum]VBA58003.1 PPE family protein PPE15 [Mycobacterium attenuatum]VBA61042.1 PPE family protein PPE15 [Mycobacterium attenuatum]